MSFFLPDRNKPLCQLMVESMTEHVSRLLLAFMSGVYLYSFPRPRGFTRVSRPRYSPKTSKQFSSR